MTCDVGISNQIGATYWHQNQMAQHLPYSQQVPCISTLYMALSFAILSALHPISGTSHKTGAICSVYIFGKYKIFCGPDEAKMFVMVKACLCLKSFWVFFRTFENFVLINAHKQNKKITLTYMI